MGDWRRGNSATGEIMVKAPTIKDRERWERIRELGCSVCECFAAIHHAETGMGGRKDHKKVFALCYHHHQGQEGIHTLGRKKWQIKYGSEQEHLEKVKEL